MRRIVHPGPVEPERVAAVAARFVPLRFTLPAVRTLLDAVAGGFAAAACRGGVLDLDGARFERFRYVIPALKAGPVAGATYSEVFAPEGIVFLREAVAVVGVKDGGPFLHCHGLWTTADGRTGMGHLLPADCVLAEPFDAAGLGALDATFDARPDPETEYTLFSPVGGRSDGHVAPGEMLLVRVRPNQDVLTAVEDLCARRGISRARLHGVGSLIGARFEDGGRLDSLATELLIREGVVETAEHGPQARMSIAIVGAAGEIREGALVHGENPFCVTFELVVEAVG
jgi:predicted DNA-binding protein with PD1-like motif